MSMALHSSLASSVPLTQNTAPVYEHRCLFTHDLRRKAKRWQDGFLKFHTFNKRIMVYDATRNYIGDTHHRTAGPEGLEDGDELELERGGVLVQVGERVGTEQTDVTELVTRRQPKPVAQGEQRGTRGPTQLQPRSTNISIPPRTPGRWTGWTGRAQIPQESPFAQRENQARATDDECGSGRAAKRRKTEDDEHVPLWQILKTSRPVARDGPVSSAASPALWARTADARVRGQLAGSSTTSKKKPTIPSNQARFQVKEVIDIASSQEDDIGPLGVYNSSSPAKPVPTRRAPPAKVNIVQTKLSQTVGARDLGPLSQDVIRAFRPPTRPGPASSAVQPMTKKAPNKQPAPASDEADPETAADERREEENQVVQPRMLTNKYKATPTTKRRAEVITPQRIPSSSPPVSTTSHIRVPVEPASIDLTIDDDASGIDSAKQTSKKPLKPLKLGGTLSPKMLLMCQQPPASRPATGQNVGVDASRKSSKNRGVQSGTTNQPQRAPVMDESFEQSMADSTPAFGTMDTARPLRRRSVTRSRSPEPQMNSARDEVRPFGSRAATVSAAAIRSNPRDEEEPDELPHLPGVDDDVMEVDFLEGDGPLTDKSPSRQPAPIQASRAAEGVPQERHIEDNDLQEVTRFTGSKDLECTKAASAADVPTSVGSQNNTTRTPQASGDQNTGKSSAVSPNKHTTMAPTPAAVAEESVSCIPRSDAAGHQHPDIVMFAGSRKPTEPRVPPVVSKAPIDTHHLADSTASSTLAEPNGTIEQTKATSLMAKSSKLDGSSKTSAEEQPIALALKPHSVIGPAKPLPATEAALPPVLDPPPQRPVHRPLRRTNSDAGVSPTKAAPTSQPNPSRQPKKPFGRASTVLNPAAAAKERQRAAPAEPVVVDEAALQNEKRLADMRNEKGAWTREAWDLFGCCPKAKEETLAWEYGKNGDGTAVTEGVARGHDTSGDGRSGNMNEVRALGGFVGAATTRRAVVA